MQIVSEAILEKFVTPALNALGYVLWGCEVELSGKYSIWRIFIDGATIDDCAKASHQISGVLAVELLDKGLGGRENYILEVSTPGMNRRLFKFEQYQSVIKKIIKIQLKRPINNQRTFQGLLQEVHEADLSIVMNFGYLGNLGSLEKGECIKIKYDTIACAHVVPEWKK